MFVARIVRYWNELRAVRCFCENVKVFELVESCKECVMKIVR